VADPIHPDFLANVDPLWPIPEETLKRNAHLESSASRKLHPHTAFGRTGFGRVDVPESIASPLQALASGNSTMTFALTLENNITHP